MRRFCILGLLMVLGWNSVSQASFEYSDFSSTTGLNLVGVAVRTENSALRLTPPSEGIGGAWNANKQPVSDGFETNFRFKVSECNWTGADGFAFVIQNQQSNALGGGGEYMGYNGISNSLAIEFDTYQNYSAFNTNDPSANHISIQSRGTSANSVSHTYSLGCTSSIPDLSNNQVHTAKVVYKSGQMDIYLDDFLTPKLSIALQLDNLLSLDNGKAWVGFTGATGADYEAHDILSWSFTEVPEPATLSLLGISGLAILRRRR